MLASMLNPRHLRAFVSVARTGSVARAAEQGHRVQSAISHSVRQLEAELGVALFERRARGMLLTEFGRVLLLRAENGFRELEAARQAFAILCTKRRWNAHAPIFMLGIGRQRLLVFLDLMKQCHMGAVARRFGISQSAVSQALREVEQGLAVQLVTRLPAGISPNPLGERLALHLQRALAELAKVEEEIASRLQGITGHVVAGTLSLGRNRLLPRAIIDVTQAHPGITVSTIEGSFEHLATLLRAAEIDFILGGLRPPEHMGGLVARPVAASAITLIARRGHPYRASMSAGGWHGLQSARWVLPKKGTWTRMALESVLAAQLTAPQVVVETADLTIMRALLLGSDLITAASPQLFEDEIEAGDLVELPLQLSAEPQAIGIMQAAAGTPTVAARLLMDAIARMPGL